jgi:hypothetical protein
MKAAHITAFSKSLESLRVGLSRIRSSNAGRLRSRPPGCLGKSERCEKHPAGKNGRHDSSAHILLALWSIGQPNLLGTEVGAIYARLGRIPWD